MKYLVVVALTGIVGLAVACNDGREGTGAGGYTPGVIANVAVGTGVTKSASSTSSGEETSSTTSSSASSTASSSSTASASSTSTGLMSEPLFPYCGCISDNLSSAGLCQDCWNSAVAAKGACADLIMACGAACTTMLDALSTECGTTANPGCLEDVAALAPNNVDDFAAVLDCICACQACDDEACM